MMLSKSLLIELVEVVAGSGFLGCRMEIIATWTTDLGVSPSGALGIALWAPRDRLNPNTAMQYSTGFPNPLVLAKSTLEKPKGILQVDWLQAGNIPWEF